MQRGLNAVVSWTQGHFSALTNNQGLISENRELLEQITYLQMVNYRLQLAAAENEKLSSLLNMPQRYTYLPTMGARVIGSDTNDFQRSFRLDLGSRDGVQVGMAVFSGGGFAGVIRYVHDTGSQFVSIVDHRFAAAVISARTEDFGTVSGDIQLMQRGLLRMDHIDAAAQIMPGDEIITTSDSSIFPRGLLVGTVLEIHTNPNGLTRHAIIQPAAHLENPEVVLVVMELFGYGHGEVEPWDTEEPWDVEP